MIIDHYPFRAHVKFRCLIYHKTLNPAALIMYN